MKLGRKFVFACLAVLVVGLSLWIGIYAVNLNKPLASASVDHPAAPNSPTPDISTLAPSSSPAPSLPPVVEPPKATPTPEAKLIAYTGPVEHIFFHPLLAYPERAFDHDSLAKGFDDWFVTVKEFKAILEGLYKNNFILIDIRSIYEEKTVEGVPTLVKKDLQLPEGKKPLVLSVDDINYYEYMIENGTISKLIVDDQGRIASVSKDKDGRERTAYDDEIVPILDGFVREHPDFSFQGAKGMLNVTGYEGILGYRTQNMRAGDYEQVKQKAMQVVEALKKDGWCFASHGWGHLDAQKISLDRLKRDTKRWKDEVEPLIGPTAIYVYPFGSSVQPGDSKFQALMDAGFRVICAIGPDPYLKVTPHYVLMDRRHIDGVALRGQSKRLAGMFDAKAVLDPVRPKN